MMLAAFIEWSMLREYAVQNLETIIRVLILVFIGLPAVWFVSRTIGRALERRTTAQAGMVVRKVILYVGVLIIGLSVARQCGIPLTPLLGAAGIVGIAVGFASQTSVSNVISGLFLIAEKPFSVGDVVKIGQTTGLVLSIDLLSLKIRTFDNQYVRIPNETLMKTEVVNITRFPIRRVDFTISVAYREDLDRIKSILLDLAKQHPQVLDEPDPLVLLTNYNNSGIDFLFAVWCVKSDFFEIRKTLIPSIKKRFDEEGVEIPFPHISLYAGSGTDALPIRLVNEEPALDASVPDDSSKT
ncbi:mechanosensitive ion channel family protein [Mucisphaera sp.]|uniref:mechanosensitive ion channel family protein n=1 Tax=Mucisphaera sp. TaxID=2913024 RepID=UPI003D0D6FC5